MNFSQYVEGDALVLHHTTMNISELVGFLQSNKHITELSLSHCRIGNEGVEVLAEGSLTHLTKLDLRVNNIDDEGAKALAEGNLTNLIELDLGGNDFGDEGVEALKHNLKSSTSLVLFCVSTVDMRCKLMDAVADLQKAIDRELGFVQVTNPQQRSVLRNIEFNILKTIFGGLRNTQATNDQQPESGAQAAANDQPSSKLSETPPISRSQSLNSLHSDGSDI